MRKFLTPKKATPTIIFFIGDTCTGKSSHSQIVSEKYMYTQISVSDLIQEETQSSDSRFGEQLKLCQNWKNDIDASILIEMIQT